MAVLLTSTYWNIKALTKRYRIIQGSSAAGKTFAILILLFERAIMKPFSRITIITSTYPMLKDGVIADMSKIYASAGLDFGKYFNKSTKDLAFDNGSIIGFRNLEDGNIHAGKGARRDILFINEANRMSLLALDPFITRTNEYILFDFNADISFYAHTEYIDADRDDVDFLIATYKENELCPIGEKELLDKRLADSLKPGASDQLKQWVNVYVKGQIGSYSERQIYNFDIIEEIPSDAKRIYSGSDIGMVDKTSLIDLYVKGSDLYLDEVFSESGLQPVKLPGAEVMSVVDRYDQVGFLKGWVVVVDSANLKTINDLRKHGYNAFAAQKPKFSVIDGISLLRSYNIHITGKSKNLIRAFEQMMWKVDKNGVIIQEIQGHEADEAVAVRYALFLWSHHNK